MDRLPSIAQLRRKESVVNHLGSGDIELAGSERIPIHCPFHLHSISGTGINSRLSKQVTRE